MPILGTAGHVDHGKSTLVEALTGIDPDRLAEEKRRGMTIDLGFAHLDLPSGLRVGIVDVPGHARFLHNMLAGVHGLDAVLLVVAADEGVMPQTREHLDILDLVGVRRVVVALTKTDLVERDWLQVVEADVRRELGARGVEATIVAVSAPRREGLDELLVALSDALAGTAPLDLGRPRLPVDRSFVMTGFGAVVTGSLVDGKLRTGQEVELLPPVAVSGALLMGRATAKPLRARVRGLEQHGRRVDEAAPGNRVAANLQGIDREHVRRGQVLAPPGTLSSTARVDLQIRVLGSASGGLKHNQRVAVHVGTAEVNARLVILEADEIAPGDRGWVQLRLAASVAVRDGDAVILRRPSPGETVAGGRIADATPPGHRRRRPGLAASLTRRMETGGRLLEELGRATHGTTTAELSARLSQDPGTVAAELRALATAGDAVAVGDRYFAAERWGEIEASAQRVVEASHRAHPLRAGMPREGLRAGLELSGHALAELVEAMLGRASLVAPAPDLVALPGWTPRLSNAQQQAVLRVLARLAEEPLSPPKVAELGAEGLDPELRTYLEEQALVVRVAAELLMLPSALEEAKERLRQYLSQHQTVTVAQARDVLGSSRRTVVPLLEYFDATRFTRREDEIRKLR